MCRGLNAVAALALVLLAVSCGGGDGEKAPTAAEICAATPDTPDVPAIVNSSELVEASGLAASRRDDNFLWAHNDSGDTARAFAIDRQGNHHGTYTLRDASPIPDDVAIDWEDMAIGPGPDEGVEYLYFADIGDNALQRPNVVVWRVPEPEVSTSDTPTNNVLPDAEILKLGYPDRSHDAETLLVDPRGSGILIVTKELAGGPSLVFRAPEDVDPLNGATLELVGEVDFPSFVSNVQVPADAPQLVRALPNLPTGGDVSPDGSLVIIRTYGSAWVWTRPKDVVLWEAFDSPPCEAPTVIEQQGEAIAFDADGRGYTTVSEGERPTLHHFSVK